MSFIKEKQDGTLKRRTCTDGSKQHRLYDKVDTTSPTVHADSVIIVLAIDAFEGRAVGTRDIKGACLCAY